MTDRPLPAEWMDLDYYPGPFGHGLPWSDEQSDPLGDLQDWLQRLQTDVPDRGLAR